MPTSISEGRALHDPGAQVAPGGTVREFAGMRPRLASGVWIATGAVVVGDVEIATDTSIWYGAVVRGDVERVRIGARSNVQDQCVVHVTRDRFPCMIGDEVTLGHRAVVHGCVVGDGALLGIGAIVLDGAEVGEGALVAAGALVTPGAKVSPGMLAVGVPAREVRPLEAAEREAQRERTLAYVETARIHADEDRS